MTSLPPGYSDNTLKIYLTIRQYPILRTRIRQRMRQELFARGIITPEAFEADVREKAIQSQIREGLHDPYVEESYETWEKRLERVRDAQTDFYFAYNLLYEDLERIIQEILAERGGTPDLITFNPELAPQEMLFEQADQILAMPEEKRRRYEARLQEIKVVLIRTMISDQLAYLNIARRWFTFDDLKLIRRRKIGYGKIGGKSAGMMLAYRILQDVAPPDVREHIRIPESYFIASDLFYTFMAANGLVHWSDQKYKTEEEMRREYPLIVRDFVRGEFPADIRDRLAALLEEIGKRPLIVRSSSLLEDNFGTSFAGKYESYFCPNQGTLEQNLDALTEAIARVYASCLNPNALLYRHHKGLVDYDERIAILLQCVEGEQFGRYFFPHGAGVGFSHNLYRWSPQIRREDGFLRLVFGLGTRAVETVGNDYPRLVALSHPRLHPSDSPKAIRRHSQQYVDVIDLEENAFKTLPVREVLTARHPVARYIAQVEEDGYLATMRTNTVPPEKLVITFDELLRRTPFAARIKTILQILEKHYGSPVDTEFTLQIVNPYDIKPEVTITLLQCRPQSFFEEEQDVALPRDLSKRDIIFSTCRMVPRGRVDGIRWVLFVPPDGYFQLDPQGRRELVQAIGLLNKALASDIFICVGPGRWGTSTPDLGVPIAYGDIYHTRALVELTGEGLAPDLEPSFGTHFFQDLMEAQIYPLAVTLGEEGVIFNQKFFYQTPNRLTDFLPSANACLQGCLRLINVEDFRPNHRMTLIMNDELSEAIAFVQPIS
ncbi:MAG: PEP/pyruvate-binding domain-containing protein [Anaerolineales bacterium]|nr:PEP/pyruvate-binding domain-containing protein [Anaerolineales bacterium]MCX7608469.1 PEP/pyruvate-binding domain-containing protein [Anaerolineales bacterium]MDW8227591.1 PEP/pyruvate-binding domain-containing protein [Anaerolineales bacterium]